MTKNPEPDELLSEFDRPILVSPDGEWYGLVEVANERAYAIWLCRDGEGYRTMQSAGYERWSRQEHLSSASARQAVRAWLNL